MIRKIVLSVLLFVLFPLFSFPQYENRCFDLPFSKDINIGNNTVNGIERINFKRKRLAGNTIYVEVGGLGYYYTINYEATLQSISRRTLNMRLGAGFISDVEKNTKATKISLPILLNLGFGETNQLEIGAGITYRIFIENEIIPSASIGFRHQKSLGGFMYRIAFTPTIETDDSNYEIIRFWGGISVGFAF